MSNVAINILAEFTGKKAFDKATKSTSALEKSVNRLGKQMLTVFSVTAVTAFGKASVKAFMEAEKANERLAQVVKNLGMSFETAGIQRQLDQISAKTGIAGELLVDAFQPLLTTTKSVTEAQNLLNLSLDVAAGTGRNVAEVSQDLALAYTGVTRGLRKYNLGLTQAELKAKSFEEIQSLLAKQFTGANAAYLETYAGKMAVLTEAAGLAQETIGKGLVDALVLAGSKDTNIDDVAKAMQNLATNTADVIRGVGVLGSRLSDLDAKSGGFLGELLKGAATATGLNLLRSLGADTRARPRAGRSFGGSSIQGNLYDRDEKARLAREKRLAAEEKRLAALKLKQAKALTAEQRKQAMAKKQSALFDLDQIGLVAALQGQLSEDERLRVRLQLALLVGNTDQAQRLSDRLADSIDKTGKLKDFINTMPDAPNPFKAWDEWLKNFSKNLAAVTGTPIPTTGGAITPPPSSNVVPFDDSMRVGSMASLTRKESFTDADFDRAVNITLQIDGKTIASAMQDQSLSGNNTSVNRTYGGFAGFM
jgi:hypothetical protein